MEVLIATPHTTCAARRVDAQIVHHKSVLKSSAAGVFFTYVDAIERKSCAARLTFMGFFVSFFGTGPIGK
jgi:hypothetical protein